MRRNGVANGRCLLLCFDCIDGYGDAGLPPHCPPGAKLEVDLELLSFTRVEEVTEEGGGVMRKIVSEVKGAKSKMPNEGAKVVVNFTATLADGTIFDKQEAMTFTVDEGERDVCKQICQ